MTPPAEWPTVGLIVPPAGDAVPPEAEGLYPRGVRFAARSLALGELSIAGYGRVIDRVATLARRLREEEGARAVVLMGTSLSFFRGGAFNEELVEVMQGAAGVPATTMSNAIRDALRAVGARRVAVGTAYAEEVNDKLAQFLRSAGFEIAHVHGLGLTDPQAVLRLGEGAVANLALAADSHAGGLSDAVLISCGGLKSLSLSRKVEPVIGKPVIASATAGAWAAVRLVGLSGKSEALGRLGEVPLAA
ncbi:aspartate/glutamate racemase family protein [Aureimonas populi]|uniref:Aspartate/glutamate racemase family protein n=1 Tax=Aureimonas populi TaxID=1701758 RepID=A0ABW5CJ18_9HYPH|nr:aspartate/glutamate racemase family protein [Aureimonas populi]